ncbi:MAG: substrate-binding domain-containing protein [Planctomycetota bacterium]|nr:substrate-binding domain-containing protein [Planctomycetota bacterium]
MASIQNETSNAHRLAQQLEEKIHTRGLGPGDRFLTASEAGLVLGVSTATAHRSMKILVDRDILIRYPSRGTFVGPHFKTAKQVKLKVINILSASIDKIVADFPVDSIIQGIRTHFPDTSVQLNYMPSGNRAGDQVAYVRELIRVSRVTSTLTGMIPSSSSREVYRLLADEGVPMVIFGSPYAGQEDLPSVDLDFRESGWLMAQYLIDRGHRRMALVGRMSGFPGENDLFDGISSALTAADLPHNALIIRTVPDDIEAFTAQIRELLVMPERPTGLIATKRIFARAAGKALEELGFADRLEIIFQDTLFTRESDLPYVSVRPKIPFQEIACLVGETLRRICEGQPLERNRLVVPVELRLDHVERTRFDTRAAHDGGKGHLFMAKDSN